MPGIKIFEAEAFGQVRVVDVDGEPWFVARDVANALGYVDTTQAIRMHCEKAKDFRGVEMTATATPMKIIPEEDVYALIFGSQLDSAKAFRRWLCDEVLPSIRRTGHYGGYALPRVPQSFPDALRMIADIEEEKQLSPLSSGTTTSEPRPKLAADAKPRPWLPHRLPQGGRTGLRIPSASARPTSR